MNQEQGNSPRAPRTFKKHINGLRGIAILAVLLFHLYPPICPLGFRGVDLFLIISGFFLLPDLLDSMEKESWDLKRFYVNKCRRILAPTIPLLIIVSLVSFIIYPPQLLSKTLSTAAFTCLFVPNFYLDKQGGYFDISSSENPLLHLWYLGVICQVYFITPWLLFFCRFRRRFLALLSILIIGVLSYLLMRWGADIADGKDSWRAFCVHITGIRNNHFNTLTRYWEIVCGLIAFALCSMERTKWSGMRSVAAVFSLIVFVLLLYRIPLPTSPLKFVIISCILLISFGNTHPCSYILNLKPVQWIGSVSFSLYLLHWPVFCIGKYICMDRPSFIQIVLMLVVSIFIGWLWWRYAEKGLCRIAAKYTGGFFCVLFLATVSLCFLSLPSVSSEIQKYSLPGKAQNLANIRSESFCAPRAYELETNLPSYGEGLITLGEPSAHSYDFALMGDSHAWHFRYGFHCAALKRGVKGVAFANSVAPFWNYQVPPNDSGDINWGRDYALELMHWLQTHESIKFIFVSMHWERRLFRELFSGSDWCGIVYSQTTLSDLRVAGLLEFCRRVREMGKTVVLVRDTPHFGDERPAPLDELFRCTVLHRTCPMRFVSKYEFDKQHRRTDAVFACAASKYKALLVDPTDKCRTGNCYPALLNGKFLYRDSNHLSFYGSLLLGEAIISAVYDVTD